MFGLPLLPGDWILEYAIGDQLLAGIVAVQSNLDTISGFPHEAGVADGMADHP
jgi:hypothetical protein